MKPQNYKNTPIKDRCYKVHQYKNTLFLRGARINRKKWKHLKMLSRREEDAEKENN